MRTNPIKNPIKSPRPFKKMTDEKIAESIKLYQEGLSCGQIGEIMGITRTAMWSLLSRRTEMRPRERMGADNTFHRGGVKAHDPAQNKVEKAILRGDLTRPPTCENCGQEKVFKDGRSGIQAHHDDYNKPLDVRWLCQPCHHEWHRHNKAVEAR